jgi:electron transfer flavoprotein alpha subunit
MQDMGSNKSVMVFVDWRKGEAAEVSLELLNKGRVLASTLKSELQAVIISAHNHEVIKIMADFGADRIYFVDHPLLEKEPIELYAGALSQLFIEKKPAIFLLGATILENDLASRISARLKTGLVCDCVELTLNEQGFLLMTKLIHDGRIAGTFFCPRPTLQIATVVPGVFEKKNPRLNKKTEVEVCHPVLKEEEMRFQVLGRIKADPETLNLDEAEIVVSGGRGLGNRENFELVRQLAKNLEGVTGASLGAVDADLVERKCLVGQTGTTVTPDLYVACGISGSIYHVLGMKDSRAIVSINKDPRADIFKYADMGLVGDAVEILKAINDRLSRRSGKRPLAKSDAREI